MKANSRAPTASGLHKTEERKCFKAPPNAGWSVVLNTSNICDSLLRLPNVLALVPVGRSTLWLWVREGRFPKPIKLGPMTTAWRASEVSAWLEAAGRDAA